MVEPVGDLPNGPDWEEHVSFWVPGRVVPWKRMGGYRKRFTPPESREYKNRVMCYALESLPADWELDGRFEIYLTSFFKDYGKRDLDNVAKQVCDALTGVVYKDDCRIDRLVVERAVSCGLEGVLIEVQGWEQEWGRERCRIRTNSVCERWGLKSSLQGDAGITADGEARARVLRYTEG